MSSSGLPHPLLVELAREAIADGDWSAPAARADELRRSLLQPVINATGVLLHTNLGRAPTRQITNDGPVRALNVELDLRSGQRGSRQASVGSLFATLCGAEAAMVVNNNAAAVLLVLAAMARGGEVLVARGESVEIGGGFRVPEVMEQSGAQLRDVGTTNRTRLADYERAITPSTALTLKVHPSNYRVEGFVEETSVAELATLPVPVVADIGSGLLDASCPWLPGGPPAWLSGEPAALQTLGAGAAVVTFSCDKLLGGPQAGIIAGERRFVDVCARHPLARALRPGGLVLAELQEIALVYLRREVTSVVPFWRAAAESVSVLERRARSLCDIIGSGEIVATEALPGAGSLPGSVVPSVGLAFDGDHLTVLRRHDPPVIARVRDGRTIVDLRAIDPLDDTIVAAALIHALDTSTVAVSGRP
jgi:L-seryl-tRNA(Ser) seleniumtransferase